MNPVKYYIDIQPLEVPSSVTLRLPTQVARTSGGVLPTVETKDLDPRTLAQLADQWRVTLFERAGKSDPAIIGTIGDAVSQLSRGGRQ